MMVRKPRGIESSGGGVQGGGMVWVVDGEVVNRRECVGQEWVVQVFLEGFSEVCEQWIVCGGALC